MQARITKTFNVKSKEDIDFIRSKTSSFLSAYQSLKNFYSWTALIAFGIFATYQLGFHSIAFMLAGLTMLCYSPLKAMGTRKSFEDAYQNNLHELVLAYGWCIEAGPHVLHHPDVLKMIEAIVNHVDQECILRWNFPQEAEPSEQFKTILANSQHKIFKNLLDKPKEETSYLLSSNKEPLAIVPYDPKDSKSTERQLWEDSCRLVNNYLFRYKSPVLDNGTEVKAVQGPYSFFSNFVKDTMVPNISAATSQVLGFKKA